MTSFFNGIAFIFEKILFIPMDLMRNLELSNWWTANIINWIFIIICSAAFVYWFKQMKIAQKNKEDDQDTTAHSFLK